MLFPTFKFFVFFAIVFTVYWSLPTVCRPICRRWSLNPHRMRMGWLFLASCAFYVSWNPWLILLILFSASVDYWMALAMPHARSLRMRRAMLILSISVNLGLLAFFKYVNFFLDNADTVLNVLGFNHQHRTISVLLPLGISFYTFETISYVVDVYRGRTQPVRNALDYALYIMFFPHLVAGPIVRPHEFLPQIGQSKRWNWDRLQLGAQFFLLGLFKKAVIADHLAGIVDPVFASPAEFASSAAWFAVVGYAVQIYCDFSGYSDMAVGLAHTLGFKLPQNFNMPYFAASITEFWRRWHVSLSTWLRDYLYVPLGGNRQGAWKTYRNLFITMLLGGLWHGASWTFVAWGAYHGGLLAVHRFLRERWPNGLFASTAARPLAIVATFLLVCIGWVFFRVQSFADAGTLLTHLCWPTAGKTLSDGQRLLALACILTVLAGHLAGTFLPLKRIERWLPAPVLGGAMAMVLVAAQVLLPEDGKAFIYFQF